MCFNSSKLCLHNTTNIVKHPLIIVKPNELKLEIRDLPENELSPRYSTDCTRP